MDRAQIPASPFSLRFSLSIVVFTFLQPTSKAAGELTPVSYPPFEAYGHPKCILSLTILDEV